jgi:hypothetical protein
VVAATRASIHISVNHVSVKSRSFRRSGKVIVPLTVRAVPRSAAKRLDEQIAMKLA